MFKGFVLDAGKTLQAPAPKPGRKLEFLGDSFTCGWDNEGVGAAPEQSYYPYMKENNYLTYGPMVGRYFNAECSILAWSGTSIATPATARLFEGYDQTLAYETTKNWSFSSWVPDATIIYLGMNDGGIAQQQFETAYSSFIARIRAKRPDTELICLWWRPWGNDPIGTYVTNVVSSKTAAGDTKIHAALLDFSWVAADLAQGHPTVSGNQKIADNLVPVIQGILGWSTDTSSPSAPGIVRDGATAGIDISSTVSTTQLSANWTVGADAESGISGYLYAVGTTAGGTNTKSWTTIGNVLSTTTALNLTLGTTYYFSVKSINGVGLVSATAANSNGQFVVAVSTAVVDTSSPTAPGIVRDGAATGVDISSTMSNGTLSANWTAGSDPESAVTGYRYAIGTTAGGTNTAGWAALGNVLSVTRNGLTLATGATYYFTVKAVNSIGLVSISAANSNGQYIVAIDTSDVTAPSNISVVRDGLSSDVDSSTSLTQLSANWDSSADAESSIARYWYAIGTQASGPGASNTLGWTDNGQLTSITAAGLTLSVNVTYYVSVKAENNVGLQSSTTTSNGQVILAPAPPDTIPPVITLVSAQNITANTAIVAWTTDEPSTSLVEYGRLINYDKSTILDSSLGLSHSGALANLLPGTLYHYRVISRDASGNETQSADYTFTTPGAGGTISEAIHAYPNPCKVSVSNPVKFRISGANISEVSIYTISGRLIRKLADTSSAEIQWDGTNADGEKVGRGIYIYKITSTAGDTVTGKIALTK
ncbi:MAG: hypothetical protein A2297_02195 [Elusimicrobia bacterium RIFOXYB2_FULL_48_7]|nr:MAG: hypothetical protein A2297_02195 [Elusimicrobia bacterium RIFOXYB2_FULL_48_7]